MQEQDAVGGEEREGQRVQNAYADIMRCEMVCQVVRRIFQISATLAMAVGLGGCCLHQTSHAEKTYCVIDLTSKSNEGKYPMSLA